MGNFYNLTIILLEGRDIQKSNCFESRNIQKYIDQKMHEIHQYHFDVI